MKGRYITFAIIAGVVLIYLLISMRSHPEVDKEIAQCIGNNSVLYVQLGCSHCEDQEKLFGNNYQYINVVDCFFELEKCGNITGTPTWVIKNQSYSGVQTIEKLKEITGC